MDSTDCNDTFMDVVVVCSLALPERHHNALSEKHCEKMADCLQSENLDLFFPKSCFWNSGFV